MRDIISKDRDDELRRIAEIVIEECNRNLRAELQVLRGWEDMQKDIKDMKYIIETKIATKNDVKLLQRAIKDTNNDVSDHGKRITKLEAKPA